MVFRLTKFFAHTCENIFSGPAGLQQCLNDCNAVKRSNSKGFGVSAFRKASVKNYSVGGDSHAKKLAGDLSN